MPIDPLMHAFLEQLAAQPAPKTYELSPDQAREMFRGLIQLVGPKDVPVGKVEDITIPGPRGDISARIYRPVAAGSDLMPTLIYFHGGGFVIGDVESYDGLCRLFANEGGFCVISVDYRLAPEDRFPAAADDAFAAASWIEQNGAQIGVDANRLAVGGDSAGGQLAAVTTLMAREAGGPKLAFQMLLFPVTRIGANTPSMQDFATGYFLEKATLDWFYDHYAPGEQDRQDIKASPLLADLAGLPPAYIAVAGFDPLHDEGVQYAQKLRTAGVPTVMVDYTDLVHDFIFLQGVLPQAHEAVKAAALAVKAGLDAA